MDYLAPHWLWLLLAATATLYTALTVGAYAVIRSMTRRWREGATGRPASDALHATTPAS